jgi:hypothetical protein
MKNEELCIHQVDECPPDAREAKTLDGQSLSNQVEPRGSVAVSQMAGTGASRSLPYVPAKVP